MSNSSHKYDYCIVGSGFGGSVSALRLAEKGYKVAVIETGKRWAAEDFPKNNWRIWKWLWLPGLKLQGIMKIAFFRHLSIAAGVGVGGGSLVYANTLLVPPRQVFADPQWGQGEGWFEMMAPHYDMAKKMLGVNESPTTFAGDELLKEYAAEIGRPEHFARTQVGVFFGPPGQTIPDPYFGGKGPDRTGCTFCGGCMTGCRDGAKNTLDRNYLYLAEKLGVTVIPETTVQELIPLSEDGEAGYELVIKKSTSWFARKRKVRSAAVVLSAGVLGTLPLLMKGRDSGRLDRLSSQLGKTVRTNSEAIIAAGSFDDKVDYSKGIAIASGLFVTDETHVEVVRNRKEAGAISMLTTILVDGSESVPRFALFIAQVLRHPLLFLRSLNQYHFSRRHLLILVMQTVDNHLHMDWKRILGIGPKRLRTSLPPGKTIPTYIPEGNKAARRIAEKMGGMARSSFPEIIQDAPATAHILGGARIGPDPAHGVVDPQCKVYGYKKLMVVDGSMVPVNLGVNPSLTITALAEYAMSRVPEKVNL